MSAIRTEYRNFQNRLLGVVPDRVPHSPSQNVVINGDAYQVYEVSCPMIHPRSEDDDIECAAVYRVKVGARSQ